MTSVPATSHPVTADDVETQHLAFLIAAVSRHMQTDLGAVGASLGYRLGVGVFEGLRASHLRLLSLIPRDGARLTDLTDIAAMTKQGLGQFMDALEELGYVSSSQHPADRRTRILVRTPRGDEAVEATNRVYELLEERWAADVGHDRWTTFRSVLVELGHVPDRRPQRPE
jgi:DNA-binding MarR family transcriptional regulator